MTMGFGSTINASVDGTDIVHHPFYDIGVAVSTENFPAANANR